MLRLGSLPLSREDSQTPLEAFCCGGCEWYIPAGQGVGSPAACSASGRAAGKATSGSGVLIRQKAMGGKIQSCVATMKGE